MDRLTDEEFFGAGNEEAPSDGILDLGSPAPRRRITDTEFMGAPKRAVSDSEFFGTPPPKTIPEVQPTDAFVPMLAGEAPPSNIPQVASVPETDTGNHASWTDTAKAVPTYLTEGIKQGVAGVMRYAKSASDRSLEAAGNSDDPATRQRAQEEMDSQSLARERRIEGIKQQGHTHDQAEAMLPVDPGAAAGDRSLQRIQDVTPENLSFWQKTLLSSAQSMGISIPGLIASVATGSPAPALIAMGGTTFGQSYDKYARAGVDHNRATLGASIDTAVEVLTELIPLKTTLQMLDGKRLLSMMYRLFGQELVGENTATLLQNANEFAIKNPNATAKDWRNQYVEHFKENVIDPALETTAATVLTTGIQGGGAALAGRAIHGKQKPVPGTDDYQNAADTAFGNVPRGTMDAAQTPPAPAPIPPQAQARADLESALADSRPYGEIKAERDAQAAQQAQEAATAAAEQQTQQQAAQQQEMAILAESAGLPAPGTDVVSTFPGGQSVNGKLVGLHQDNGITYASVLAEDGNQYDLATNEVQIRPKPAGDGTPAAPIVATHPDDIAAAGAVTNHEATPAQQEADNRAKGRFKYAPEHALSGLGPVAIETAKGRERIAKDGSWRVTMPVSYGHLQSAEGADGDKADVFIGDHMNARKVYVIDQINPDTRAFDETKSMLNFPDERSALDAYMNSFSDGRGHERVGAISSLSLPQYVARARADNLKKAVKYVQPETSNASEVRGHPQQNGEQGHPAQAGQDLGRENIQLPTQSGNAAGNAQGKPAAQNRGPLQVERRTNLAQRKRVGDMSHEELKSALLTDPLTGLPNRRAYDEAEKKAIQVAIDVDGLKIVNDNLGHEAGDEMLRIVGQAMKESGLDAYHISGDEFLIQANGIGVENAVKHIMDRLLHAKIIAELPDGSTVEKTGVYFSFGLGGTRNEADAALYRHKAERKAQGLRTERASAQEQHHEPAQGQQAEAHRAAAPEAPAVKTPKGALSPQSVLAEIKAAGQTGLSPRSATWRMMAKRLVREGKATERDGKFSFTEPESAAPKRIGPEELSSRTQEAGDRERRTNALDAIKNGKAVSVQDARDAGITEAPAGYVERVGRYVPEESGVKYSVGKTSNVQSNAVEYITRDLLKGKSLKASVNSFLKKFNGQDNMFLGGKVEYTAEQLTHAVMADKAQDAIKAARRMKDGMGFMALKATAQQFNLPENELAKEIAKSTDGQDANGLLKEHPNLTGGGVKYSVGKKLERDLIIQHNLSEENLLHAIRMGGIPVPSLSITKAGDAMVNFGEITLLGPAEMADPKGYARTQVFGADVYSPRYPQISYKLSNDALKKLNEILAPYREEGKREIYGAEVSGIDDLTQLDTFKNYAVKKFGKAPAWSDLKALAENTLRDVGAEEKIFQGFTNSGNRRYIPHTLDNVVRILKEEIRGGENFNYGVGSLRAHFTPRFTSVAQIRKEKGRLVSKEEFEKVKNEIDAEFQKLWHETQAYHKVFGANTKTAFGFGDTLIGTLTDAAKMGIPRALSENQFNEVPPTIQQEIAGFLEKLRHLPTEYFEAKILREVDISEFSAAVVPKGASKEVIDALKARGLEIETYQPGGKGDGNVDRRRAIAEVSDRLGDKVKFMVGYHGSPHDFDQFSLQKIGSGEGAQAYGWGLYFAGKKEIAEFYRDKLAHQNQPKVTPELRAALKEVDYLGFDSSGEAASAILQHDDWKTRWDLSDYPEVARVAEAWRKEAQVEKKSRLYEVDLPEDHTMLAWDKPLREQPEQVKDALKKAGIPEHLFGETIGEFAGQRVPLAPVTGEEAYKILSGQRGDMRFRSDMEKRGLGSPEAASRKLAELGVTGIKYADNTSRNTDQDLKDLERHQDNNRRQIAAINKELSENENNPNLLPRFFEVRRQDIDEIRQRISDTQTKIDRLKSGADVTHNYVVFDDRLIKVLAKYSTGADFSYRYLADQAKIIERIQKLAQQMNPDANIAYVPQLFGAGQAVLRSGAKTPERQMVAGSFDPKQKNAKGKGLITIALNYADPEASMDHETIHDLREMGAFRTTEWKLLEHEAEKNWKREYDVPDDEESIASAFVDFRKGKKFDGPIQGIFNKLRNFLVRIGNLLRGMGFNTVDDVFQRVERGEVAARDAKPLGRQDVVHATAKETLIDTLGITEKGVTVKKPPEAKEPGFFNTFKSPNKVAEKFPAFKPFYEFADRAQNVQERLRKTFSARLGKVDEILGGGLGRVKDLGKQYREHKTLLQDIRLTEDMLGKEFTEQELKDEFSAPEAVIQAHRLLRSAYDHALNVANNARLLRGKTEINRRTGYVPHFFHSYFISIQGRVVASAKTLREAVSLANQLARTGNQVTVVPKRFKFQSEGVQAAVIGDMDYFKMDAKLEKDLELSAEEAKNLMEYLVRRRGRSRFVGNFLQRKGAEGWEQNLDWADRHYFNMISRYAALDQFKSKAISLFENKFGKFDSQHKGLANYTKHYINDVNGVPTVAEELLNASIARAPVLGKWLGSYLGDRPSLQLASMTTNAVAIAKLALYNVSAAMVNLSQIVAIHAVLGPKATTVGIGRSLAMEGVRAGRKVGLAEGAMTDIGILKKAGVNVQQGIESGAGYSKSAQMGRLFNATTVFFQSVERLLRETAVLGAYYKHLEANPTDTHGAIEYAKQVNERTNYNYSITDTPSFIRRSGPVGQIIFQFKKFPIKTMELMGGMKGMEHASYWLPLFLLAGYFAIPGFDTLKEFLKYLFGFDMELELKEHLMQWAGADKGKRKIANTIMYGVFSNAGVDISHRVGGGDYIPSSVEDMYGPAISTAIRATQLAAREEWVETLRAISPSAGNLALMLKNDHEISSPWERGRLVTRIDPTSALLKGLGFRTTEEANQTDASRIVKYEKNKAGEWRREIVDMRIEAQKLKDRAEATHDPELKKQSEALEKKAADLQDKHDVYVDAEMVKREAIQKDLDRSERAFKSAPKDVRGNLSGTEDFSDAGKAPGAR